MKILEQIYRLQRIDYLIPRESAGSAKDFTRKLSVSVSTLFELLNCLKQLGADRQYNCDKLSYTYYCACKTCIQTKKYELS